MSIQNNHYLTEQSHEIVEVTLVNNDGNEYDILQNFISIDVYEDIYGGASTINFTVMDAHGFIIGMNIYGGELIKLAFNTKDPRDSGRFSNYENTYRINRLEEVNSSDGRSSLLNFVCVSESIYNNALINISKSYFEKTTSEIIKSIMIDNLKYKGQLNLESTKFKRNYIAPFVRPFQAINYLVKESFSEETNNGNFVFFENKDGWNLKSLESIRRSTINEKTHILVVKNSQYTTYNFNHIKGYSISKHFDVFDGKQHGYDNMDLTLVDIENKKYHSKNYNVEEYRNKITNMNISYSKRPNTDLVENGNRRVESFKFFPKIEDMANQRESLQFDHLNSDKQVMDLTIPANSEIKAGDKVYLDILNNTGETNKKLSGYWIVRSLKHAISRVAMYTHLRVIRNTEGVN